ncbi:hypothetical protein HKD37_09G025757 [Glycine soja]
MIQSEYNVIKWTKDEEENYLISDTHLNTTQRQKRIFTMNSSSREYNIVIFSSNSATRVTPPSFLVWMTMRISRARRISHLLNKWSLEHFFALWFVLGTVWIFESRFGSFRDASKFQVVYIILLAWNAMRYSFHLLLFVLLCFCVLLINTFLSYNMNMASSNDDDQISQLPSWRHKEVCAM